MVPFLILTVGLLELWPKIHPVKMNWYTRSDSVIIYIYVM